MNTAFSAIGTALVYGIYSPFPLVSVLGFFALRFFVIYSIFIMIAKVYCLLFDAIPSALTTYNSKWSTTLMMYH